MAAPTRSRRPKPAQIRTEYMPLSDLLGRHHPDNPRDHDIGGIISSIQQFGFVRNVMVNETDGLLLFGHGATTALATMKADGMPVPERIQAIEGEWLVPATRGVNLDADHARAYLLADNRLAEIGGWDESKLLDNLMEIGRYGTLNGTGFDGDDIESLIYLVQGEARQTGLSQCAAGKIAGNGHRLTCPECGCEFTVDQALNANLEGIQQITIETDPLAV